MADEKRQLASQLIAAINERDKLRDRIAALEAEKEQAVALLNEALKMLPTANSNGYGLGNFGIWRNEFLKRARSQGEGESNG